jgi:hypothetical protein
MNETRGLRRAAATTGRERWTHAARKRNKSRASDAKIFTPGFSGRGAVNFQKIDAGAAWFHLLYILVTIFVTAGLTLFVTRRWPRGVNPVRGD